MTEKEKIVYNCFHATVRMMQGKPFKRRKNWVGFEENPDYFYVKKLANFFRRHHNINMHEFFKAPFKIYNDPGYFDLKFYTTLKAISIYKMYKKENNS